MKVKYNKWIMDYKEKTSVFGVAGVEAGIYWAMVETVLDFNLGETPKEKTLMESLTARKPAEKNEAYQKLVTDREEEFWAEFNKPVFWNLWHFFSEPKTIYIEGGE